MPGLFAAVFNLLVCFGLPLGALLYYLARRRGHCLAFFLGAGAFGLAQLLLRLPLLRFLQSKAWFMAFAAKNPLVFLLLLSFSAGLFEESARYLAMRLFMKNRLQPSYALAFGLGHGGLEAAYLVGPVWAGALLQQRAQLAAAPALAILPSGVERLLAIALHVGLSLIVLCAMRRGAPVLVLLAIALHGAGNVLAVLVLQKTQLIWLSQGVLLVFVGLVYGIAFGLRAFKPITRAC